MAENFKKEDAYIISSSTEINLGERPGWTQKIFTVFPALRNSNYQLYFIGQLISLIGTWLQVVAQGWLVLQLTNSAFQIGLVAAISTAPTIVFSLFGGVIVDRFPKKTILFFTQVTEMVLAFILGVITISGVVTVPQIAVLAFLLGCVTAIDIPARQAFAIEMVGKEDLPSAIALNAGIFNAARVIGPGIAGFLIAVVGTGGAFLLNSASYIAVILALLAIKVVEKVETTHSHPLRAVQEGLLYAFTHPIIKTLLLFTGVVSVFGWSYATILPIIARDIFGLGADGLGYLYAAAGLGAMTAAVAVSAFAKKISATVFIFGGNTLFVISMVLFTFTSNLYLALFFLFFSGLGLLAQFSTINATLQRMVENKYRGRVMALYTLMFLGLSPIGSVSMGFFAEHFGTSFAIRAGVLIVFIYTMRVFFNRHTIAESQRRYTALSAS